MSDLANTVLERKASDAWQVHRTLMMTECREPYLKDNPYWTILRQDAYEALVLALTK